MTSRVEEVLAAHEPALGMFAGHSGIVGCACLSARDYRAAGFKAGKEGHRAHVAAALAEAGIGDLAADRERIAQAIESFPNRTIIISKPDAARIARGDKQPSYRWE